MNKVNLVIISGDMKDIQGVSRVTENLIYGHEKFLSFGIDMKYVYAGNDIIDCGIYKQSVIGKNISDEIYIKKRKIINKLKKLRIYKSFLVQKYFLKKDMGVERKAVQNYLDSSYKADIIMFQNPFIMSIFLEESKKRKQEVKEKTIIIAHNQNNLTDNHMQNRPSLKSTYVEKNLLKKAEIALKCANALIVLGTNAQQFFEKKYDLKSTIIYNGVKDNKVNNITKKSEEDKKIHIIAVGAFLYRKGMGLFPEALKLMKEEERSKFIIHIAGDGTDKEEITQYIMKNNLSDYFDLMGPINNVVEVLQIMDIFMLPTKFDSMPMSIIEAMMCSLPVISTKIGEIPQMVKNEKSGLLIEPNVESVVEALRWTIINEQSLQHIGNKSRRIYEEDFSLQNMISKYSRVIEKVLK